MTPLLFGSGARRLFGIYESGRASSRAARAAVLCNPWGQEYIRAHRSMRLLAKALAGSGRDTLRFDYYGTGDSAGDMVDADLAGWERDIEEAIDEIQSTSGGPRVTLLGLRLGGSLAARVAARRQRDVESLVLWDPVISGRRYLQELHTMEETLAATRPGSAASKCRDGREILGFTMTTALAEEIEAFDLLPIVAGLSTRRLTLVSRLSSPFVDLTKSLEQRPDNVLAIERLSCPPPWIEDRHTGAGAVPVEAIQRIIQWLA